ncbi:MAG: thiol:disulfide interchange protein DsbA/DsbL [Lysobacteraceae bacterium]|nr:MAG: thiol:disulfide interchange protein DsbA/DsbL [Xanthomonadaceae bacterium]
MNRSWRNAVLLALIGALVVPLAAVSAEKNWKAGTAYKVLAPSSGLPSGEVVEFFSYACVHCFKFQGNVTRIASGLPKGVSVRMVPVAWSETWEPFARSYYAAEKLGVAKVAHEDAFNYVIFTLQGKGSVGDMAAFYKKYGVDPNSFRAAAESPEVSDRLEEDRKIYEHIQLLGTPAFVVDGRYMTGEVGSYEELEALTIWLIKKAQL